ncbi:MAG: zinc metallopeptidase [Bacteroidota bacterium]
MNIGIILGVIAMGLSWIVKKRFQSTMDKLSRIPTRSGMSGKEIAESMLGEYGIADVQILSTRGMLTDHYNPAKRTVNLSEVVYAERSIAAAAVSAHECGHAVQHATSYSFLRFRSGLVPVLNIANRFAPFVLMGGIVLIEFSALPLTIGVGLLAASTLFSLITLPVEFDASRRALAWLDDTGIMQGEEYEQAKKGLRWAAMTYVVAALTSLATLLYYVSILMSRRN